MSVPLLFFSLAAFTSALLLFWVQPMVARTVLPVLGGVPSVWNTCMFFFQAALLAGYGYSHLTASRLSLRRQLLVHGGLFLVAVCFLPLQSSIEPTPEGVVASDPTVWLLGRLLITVGVPFFFVSTNAPLLQSWLARTGLEGGRDPYSLYSASNLGSLAGLLSYPILVEPRFRLVTQSRLWSAGYLVLGLLLLICMALVWRSSRSSVGDSPASSSPGAEVTIAPAGREEAIGWRAKLRWMALAFVPSSLLLGVTTYLTTDIASIPLLWIIPLAIYLISFIVVFARHPVIPWRPAARVLPIAAVGLVFLMLSRATQPIALLIVVHLLFLFIACMACHGQLAAERPPVSQLTRFYLWFSFGSVLGSACTALLAPRIFSSIVEYPLAVVLACLLRPSSGVAAGIGKRSLDVAFPVLLGTLTLSLVMMASIFDWTSTFLRSALVAGVPLILVFTFVDRPLRFGLGLGVVMLTSGTPSGLFGTTLHVERNFFGVSRVTSGSAGRFHQFIHGNTVHGRQRMDSGGECEPLTYYHRTGPVGELFKWLESGPRRINVAMIGLGAGSTGCYAQPDQQWTFYEIDPAVIRIAGDTNYFSYLSRCTHAEFRIVEGDARLRLREAPEGHFQLIVLDAFSSDAIPVHLLTREALQLYLSKLAPGGAIAFHISNRYLDLEPVVGALSRDAGLVCRAYDDWNVDSAEKAAGKEESQWVIFVREPKDLRQLNRNSHWLPVDSQSDHPVWTDDFSNILSVFKWR